MHVSYQKFIFYDGADMIAYRKHRIFDNDEIFFEHPDNLALCLMRWIGRRTEQDLGAELKGDFPETDHVFFPYGT
jgi:hypothetical protein